MNTVLLKNMADKLKVFWRGNPVGWMGDLQPDMWYLDGTWIPDSNTEAEAFEALACEFDAKLVMEDPIKGTRIVISDNDDPEHSGTDALVCSLTDGRLFIRRIYQTEAVDWLRNNVH